MISYDDIFTHNDNISHSFYNIKDKKFYIHGKDSDDMIRYCMIDDDWQFVDVEPFVFELPDVRRGVIMELSYPDMYAYYLEKLIFDNI